MKETKKESMIKLKNILAENMLRFGVKNLSESDKQHLTEDQSQNGQATIYIEYTTDKTGAMILLPTGGARCQFVIQSLFLNNAPITKKAPLLAEWMPSRAKLLINGNTTNGTVTFKDLVLSKAGDQYQIGYKGDVILQTADLKTMGLVDYQGKTIPSMVDSLKKGMLKMQKPPVQMSLYVDKTGTEHVVYTVIKAIPAGAATTAPK